MEILQVKHTSICQGTPVNLASNIFKDSSGLYASDFSKDLYELEHGYYRVFKI